MQLQLQLSCSRSCVVINVLYIKRSEQDVQLQTPDLAVAFFFYTDALPRQEAALKTSYNIIQEFASVRIRVIDSAAQIFSRSTGTSSLLYQKTHVARLCL